MKTFSIALILLVMTCMPVALAQSQTTLECYRLSNTVTFDGKWTSPDEWADVPEILLGHYDTFTVATATHPAYPNAGNVFLRIKHDDSNLYFLMDVTNATHPIGIPSEHGWSFTGVFVDLNNNKSSVLQKDDTVQAVSWMEGQPLFEIIRGEAGGWSRNIERSPVTVKYIMGTTQHSSQAHLISEGMMPIGGRNEIGIAFLATNLEKAEANAWPRDFVEFNPNTWGTLKLLSATYVEATQPTSTQTPAATPTPTPTPTISPTATPSTTEATKPTPTMTTTTTQGGLDTNTLGMLAGAVIVILVVGAVFLRRRKKDNAPREVIAKEPS